MEIKKLISIVFVLFAMLSTVAFAEDRSVFEYGKAETFEEELSLGGWGEELFTKCIFETDVQFKEIGAGIALRSQDNKKSGTIIRAVDKNGKMTLAADGGTGSYFINYIELNPQKWYHIKLLGKYGVTDGMIDMVVDTYDENMQVVDTKNYYVILMNEMYASSGVGPEHITVLPNTVVDNVKVTELLPDSIKLSAPSETVVKDSETALSVKAYRNGEVLEYDLPVKYTVSECAGVSVTDDGILKIDSDAAESVFSVAASSGVMTDTVIMKVVSSDILTVKSVALNEDETVIKEINVLKNYYYDDTVVFVITVYDSTGALVDTEIKKIPGTALTKESCVAIDYVLPERFDKNTWSVEINAWGDSDKCSTSLPDSDVAVRSFYEQNGGAVQWIDEHRVVAGMLNGKTTVMQIDNSTVYINGNALILQKAPYIINDTTYVTDVFIKSVFE